MTLEIIVRAGRRPVAPRVSNFTAYFWEQLEQGRMVATECGNCKHISFPPKSHCPECGGQPTEWTELCGNGTLYSVTTVHAVPALFAEEVPYHIAIIDLEEGVRLVTRLLITDKPPLPDSNVKLVVVRYEDGCLFAAKSIVSDTD